MKILVTIPNFTEQAREALASLGEVIYQPPTQDELANALADCDAVLCGLGLRFDRATLAGAKKLKVLATATTGLDHLDLAAAEARGIAVLSLRGEEEFLNSITGTAELAFALLLNLARRIPPALTAVKRGEWERERFRGHALAGQTLGVVGVGRLGRMMVRYGRAFGKRVLGHDPKVDVAAHGAEPVSFEKLLSESDFISLHLHLAPETTKLFNRRVFARMKPSAYLINTSRGEIVDESDLLAALEQGRLAGYATDVLAGENNFGERAVSHPLIDYAQTHDNLIIVPHLGGMTYQSREATDHFIARKLAEYLKNQNV